MQLASKIHNFLFNYDSYKRGLVIHLGLFVSYTLLHILVYFYIENSIRDKPTQIYYQLNCSKYFVVLMLLHVILLIYIRWASFKILVRGYFTEEGSAYDLAIFRIIFFSYLGGYFLSYSAKKLISWSYLPSSSKVGLPFIDWLIQILPVSPAMYYSFALTAGILCWFICLGLFTRFSLVLLIPFAFYVVGVPMFYGKINHNQILLWVPLIFCFSPMADVLSIDRLLKRSGTGNTLLPHIKYALPFRILWLQLAIIYCFAGFIKLWDCGLAWALSDSMINQMQWEWVEHYDKIPEFRLDRYPLLAKAGGLMVIYFEVLYFLLIIKPSGRIWAFLGAFSMHKIAGYFMYIDFGALRTLGVSYINWQKLFRKITFRSKIHSPIRTETSQIPIWAKVKREGLRSTFIIGISMLSINFVFSLFKIHSYPFSSYPTYSALVQNEITLVKMEAYTKENERVDVRGLGKNSNFRWETFRPFEQQIAHYHEIGDTLEVHKRMKDYWTMWNNNVKGLEMVSRVTMILETGPIAPEKRSKIRESVFLGTIYPLIKSNASE